MLYSFGDFEVDTQHYELRRAGIVQPLEPQGFKVLAYLLEQRDRVVSRNELLAQLWPGQYVSEATLIQRLVAIRRALGDTGRTQRYIRTVHGLGYRFVEAVAEQAAPGLSSSVAELPMVASPPSAPAGLIGREAELAALHACFAQVRQGHRQLVFVSGEAGIGKTTLLEAFVSQVEGPVWVGHGQCVEHYGAGEAYLPLLEALGRLGREPGGEPLGMALRRHAPSWLVHLPTLLSVEEYRRLQPGGSSRERMLRELAEALEDLTTSQPLLLVLEDLHWSDVSTVEWLTYVARRRDPAQLFILGTYRPNDALLHHHPIRTTVQELKRHRQSHELAIPYWSVDELTTYLTRRFGALAFAADGVRLLHQWTHGNPFFLVNMVETLEPRDLLEGSRHGSSTAALHAPESIRRLIEAQLERLAAEEQMVLEMASVVGESFDTATLAAGLERTVDMVEASCAALARRGQFIRPLGVEAWPDATVATRYGFLHALYPQILYERLAAGRRVRLHQRIGLAKESAYGTRAHDIAAELAMHFVRGQEPQRSVQYLHTAALNALQRCAYQESLTHLRLGLEQLPKCPDSATQSRWEITLQLLLARLLHITRGSWAAEVGQAYTRAQALCQASEPTPEHVTALVGLWYFYNNRSMLDRARQLGEQLLTLMQTQPDPPYLSEAYMAVGYPTFLRGQFVQARQHFQEGLRCYESRPDRARAWVYGQSPGVQHRALLARTLWLLGYADQARQQGRQARALATALEQPSSQAMILYHTILLYQQCQDIAATVEHAEALRTLANEHGFTHWEQAALVHLGWTQVVQGSFTDGLARMQQGIARILDSGAEIFRPPFLFLLADAYTHARYFDTALQYLTEAADAMVACTMYSPEAEIWRLRGDVLRQRSDAEIAQAESCWQQALTVAQRQQARALELRVALRLSRLWQQQGKHREARTLLAGIYDWFREGFDTVDLQQARAFLEAMTG